MDKKQIVRDYVARLELTAIDMDLIEELWACDEDAKGALNAIVEKYGFSEYTKAKNFLRDVWLSPPNTGIHVIYPEPPKR